MSPGEEALREAARLETARIYSQILLEPPADARAEIDESALGVGSVCRRQHTGQIEHILSTLAADGLRLHGFGLKVGGLRAGAHHLTSADSLAWSARGRRVKPAACGSTTHASEANCLTFALNWRRHVQTVIDAPKQLGLTLEGVA